MEYFTISNRTCSANFFQKADKVTRMLNGWVDSHPNDLIPAYIDPRTGNPGGGTAGMGALSDSFYEYLLKVKIQTFSLLHAKLRGAKVTTQMMTKHAR